MGQAAVVRTTPMYDTMNDRLIPLSHELETRLKLETCGGERRMTTKKHPQTPQPHLPKKIGRATLHVLKVSVVFGGDEYN